MLTLKPSKITNILNASEAADRNRRLSTGRRSQQPSIELIVARQQQGTHAARRTLAGVEAMAMLAKGQVHAAPADDVPGQRAFVHQVFGPVA
jgi:hypothetical protein